MWGGGGGRIVVAGGEAGRGGICTVCKTNDGGVRSPWIIVVNKKSATQIQPLDSNLATPQEAKHAFTQHPLQPLPPPPQVKLYQS